MKKNKKNPKDETTRIHGKIWLSKFHSFNMDLYAGSFSNFGATRL
jgi:hypothetical protein